MFTPEQKQLLAAPLDKRHVKQREQSGRKLSYVEGWHAIAEANRIFGFDGWTRETVELRCVSEKDRLVGKKQEPGWGVTYIARVRISIGDVIRDGCGSGHGIDRDLGQAHESALKEAETDAMKRALMTFGNPFGLALYDKEQANVTNGTEHDTACAEYVRRAKEAIAAKTDVKTLGDWWNGDEQAQMRRALGLTDDELDELKALVIKRRDELSQKEAA